MRHMYIVILGCGRVGAELARLLSLEGNDVVIIDQKEAAFSRLGQAFNGITLKGNGVFSKTLEEAGIQKADIFCALTNYDNINIMASQVAKGIFKTPRVIARVYDPRKADIYNALGLDIISETTLFASMLRDKIIDKRLSSYLIETNHLGILELPVTSNQVGKTVEELNKSGEFIITAIQKPGKLATIPDPKKTVAKGDELVAVVKMASIKKIKKEFGLEAD